MPKKKQLYDKKRAMAVKAVAEEYGVSEVWVRKCITRKKSEGNARNIKDSYTEKYTALAAVVG